MAVSFKKATKVAAKLRMALVGPAGSGKTYTALTFAARLGGPVALVDSEHGSASKYADLFDFATVELATFHPQRYIEAIQAAQQGGFRVLVIDSLSHAWSGKEGALELVDRAAARSQSKNSFGAWREVTPLHNQLVDAILAADLHVIATLRTKTEYVQEKDDRGKSVVRKVGLQPVQRDGLEYEFDVVVDMDQENTLAIGKTRCPALAGQVYRRPGNEVPDLLAAWLSGPEAPARQPEAPESVEDIIRRIDAARERRNVTPEGLAKRLKEKYGQPSLDGLSLVHLKEVLAAMESAPAKGKNGNAA